MSTAGELREYKCEYYSLRAHAKSCFFCDHCTDIFFDSDGPYMFLCDIAGDVHSGLSGTCEGFYEEGK